MSRPALRGLEESSMTHHTAPLQVGATVPDFKLDYFDPATGDFGSTSLGAIEKAGKWTILFFYPADFTFV
jgi:alkyl hydroperoxide reductase subunit AhpC